MTPQRTRHSLFTGMPSSTQQRGMTLVELMVAMLLGLVVTGVVVSIFLASRTAFRTNMAIGETQDSARIAFELLARDARQAGLTGCGNLSVSNVLKNGSGNAGSAWWANWNDNVVRGYDDNAADPAVATGTATGNRVAGTDSVQLIGAESSGISVRSMSGSTITLWSPATNWANGDALILCDPDHAALFQLSSGGSSANLTLSTAGTPGNCTTNLGFPTNPPVAPATACTADPYTYQANAQVARLNAADWYVGVNEAKGRSLYRMAPSNTSGTLSAQAQEVVRNVTDLQIQYREKGAADFVNAPDVGNWSEVDAMRVTLTLQSNTDRVTTASTPSPLTRSLSTVIALRNRLD